MYRIGLNTKIRDNFAFFCPDTRLHLTLANPVDNVDRVSPAIERGLQSKALIDLTPKSDAEPEQDMKNDNQEPDSPEGGQEPEEPESNEPEKEEDIFEQLEESQKEPDEEKKPAKRSKNKAAKPTE